MKGLCSPWGRCQHAHRSRKGGADGSPDSGRQPPHPEMVLLREKIQKRGAPSASELSGLIWHKCSSFDLSRTSPWGPNKPEGPHSQPFRESAHEHELRQDQAGAQSADHDPKRAPGKHTA